MKFKKYPWSILKRYNHPKLNQSFVSFFPKFHQYFRHQNFINNHGVNIITRPQILSILIINLDVISSIYPQILSITHSPNFINRTIFPKFYQILSIFFHHLPEILSSSRKNFILWYLSRIFFHYPLSWIERPLLVISIEDKFFCFLPFILWWIERPLLIILIEDIFYFIMNKTTFLIKFIGYIFFSPPFILSRMERPFLIIILIEHIIFYFPISLLKTNLIKNDVSLLKTNLIKNDVSKRELKKISISKCFSSTSEISGRKKNTFLSLPPTSRSVHWFFGGVSEGSLLCKNSNEISNRQTGPVVGGFDPKNNHFFGQKFHLGLFVDWIFHWIFCTKGTPPRPPPKNQWTARLVGESDKKVVSSWNFRGTRKTFWNRDFFQFSFWNVIFDHIRF